MGMKAEGKRPNTGPCGWEAGETGVPGPPSISQKVTFRWVPGGTAEGLKLGTSVIQGSLLPGSWPVAQKLWTPFCRGENGAPAKLRNSLKVAQLGESRGNPGEVGTHIWV